MWQEVGGRPSPESSSSGQHCHRLPSRPRSRPSHGLASLHTGDYAMMSRNILERWGIFIAEFPPRPTAATLAPLLPTLALGVAARGLGDRVPLLEPGTQGGQPAVYTGSGTTLRRT